MPEHTSDHDDRSREQANGGGDATVPPRRRTRSSTQDTWHVERIDTEPMSAQQYDLAVAALATLIAQWSAEEEKAKKVHE